MNATTPQLTGNQAAVSALDRRQHVRVAIVLDLSARTLAQPTRRFSGNTVNVSVDGGLLWLPGLAPRALFLELSLAVPAGSIHASAEIVWRRDPLVGVRFQRMSADDRARFADFLRRLR
jgi:c-di-GMP-binding flagellar brake protein YcgR